MKHTLKGDRNRNVWLDGKPLSPIRSQMVCNHSPDGFNWGYAGSGPAQLALAVILELTDKPDHYQSFKNQVIETVAMAGEPFEIEFELAPIFLQS